MGSLRTARSLTSRNMSSAPPAATLMLSSLLSRFACHVKEPARRTWRVLGCYGQPACGNRPISLAPYCRVSPPLQHTAPARNSAALRASTYLPASFTSACVSPFSTDIHKDGTSSPVLLVVRNPLPQLRSNNDRGWLAPLLMGTSERRFPSSCRARQMSPPTCRELTSELTFDVTFSGTARASPAAPRLSLPHPRCSTQTTSPSVPVPSDNRSASSTVSPTAQSRHTPPSSCGACVPSGASQLKS